MAAEYFPPGEYVADELAARGIARANFATYMGWSVEGAEDFFAGRVKMLAGDAEKISKMFGTSVEMWLNLERQWRKRPAD